MPKKKSVKSVKKVDNNPKKMWIILGLLLIVFIGVFAVAGTKQTAPVSSPATQTLISFDFGNQKIKLDDNTLSFVQGSYQSTDGTDLAKISERTVNSTDTAAAAVLVDAPGGSGTFYYLVGANNKNGKEVYSTPVLLGDRIKVESINVDNPGMYDNGVITVNFLDRTPTAPMTSEPTTKMVKKYAIQNNGDLIQVLNK